MPSINITINQNGDEHSATEINKKFYKKYFIIGCVIVIPVAFVAVYFGIHLV